MIPTFIFPGPCRALRYSFNGIGAPAGPAEFASIRVDEIGLAAILPRARLPRESWDPFWPWTAAIWSPSLLSRGLKAVGMTKSARWEFCGHAFPPPGNRRLQGTPGPRHITGCLSVNARSAAIRQACRQPYFAGSTGCAQHRQHGGNCSRGRSRGRCDGWRVWSRMGHGGGPAIELPEVCRRPGDQSPSPWAMCALSTKPQAGRTEARPAPSPQAESIDDSVADAARNACDARTKGSRPRCGRAPAPAKAARTSSACALLMVPSSTAGDIQLVPSAIRGCGRRRSRRAGRFVEDGHGLDRDRAARCMGCDQWRVQAADGFLNGRVEARHRPRGECAEQPRRESGAQQERNALQNFLGLFSSRTFVVTGRCAQIDDAPIRCDAALRTEFHDSAHNCSVSKSPSRIVTRIARLEGWEHAQVGESSSVRLIQMGEPRLARIDLADRGRWTPRRHPVARCRVVPGRASMSRRALVAGSGGPRPAFVSRRETHGEPRRASAGTAGQKGVRIRVAPEPWRAHDKHPARRASMSDTISPVSVTPATRRGWKAAARRSGCGCAAARVLRDRQEGPASSGRRIDRDDQRLVRGERVRQGRCRRAVPENAQPVVGQVRHGAVRSVRKAHARRAQKGTPRRSRCIDRNATGPERVRSGTPGSADAWLLQPVSTNAVRAECPRRSRLDPDAGFAPHRHRQPLFAGGTCSTRWD